jgi:hypothetical protein
VAGVPALSRYAAVVEPWAIIGIVALIVLLSGAMGAWQRTIAAGPRRMAAFAERYGEGARWLVRALVGATSLLVAALLPSYQGAIGGGILGGLILLWALVGYLRTVRRRRRQGNELP